MRRFFLPFLTTILFVFESIFVDLVQPHGIFSGDKIFVPHFVVILIIFITVYGDKMVGMLYGIIFGLLVDLVYTEIIGVYMFSFPLVAYIVAKVMNVLQSNLFILSSISIIFIVIMEFFVYGVNLLINLTEIELELFFYKRLIPTVLLNGVFIFLFSYPLRRFVTKVITHNREEL